MLNTLLFGFIIYQVTTAAPRNVPTILAKEGEPFNLQCDLPADYRKKVEFVSWTKDTIFLHKIYFNDDGPTPGKEGNRYRIYLRLSEPDCVLQIHAVTEADEGEYRCRIRFKSGGRRDGFVRLKIRRAATDVLNSTSVENNFTNPKDNSNSESNPAEHVTEISNSDVTIESLNPAGIENNSTDIKENLNKDSDPAENVTALPNPGTSEATLNSTGTEKNSTIAGDENKDEVPVDPVTELPDPGTVAQNSTLPDFILIDGVTISSTDVSSSDIHESEDDAGSNSCRRPPVLNGSTTQLKGDEHPEGTVATYRCEFGFIPQGSGKLQAICEWDEQNGRMKWKKPKVACVPRSCGDPGYVRFGHRVGNLFTFPNKVDFKCDEGYKLKGTGVRYCQVNGEWSGRLPTCEEIYCSVPPHPENGRVKYSSLEYGSLLQYECDKGFVLKNHEPRYCSEDATWSNDQPSCSEAACPQPDAPEHGSVRIVGEPKVGSLALYSCFGERKLVGGSTSRCLETGEWTFKTPKCVSNCIVPEVSNGRVGRFEVRVGRYRTTTRFVEYEVDYKIDSGEKAVLLCSNGFLPEGSSDGKSDVEITCKDGEWVEPMECKSAACLGPPPDIENGQPVVSKNHHGYVIYYKCTDEDNYKKIIGHVQCQYGSWVGNPPSCIDTRCYLKDLNVVGLLKPDRQYARNNSNFFVTCTQGYRVSKDYLQISCLDGQWNIPPNPCIEEDRTHPPTQLPMTSTRRSYTQFVRTTKRSRPTSSFATMKKPTDVPAPTTAPEEECFCTYSTFSGELIAYANGIKLEYGSKIRRGDSVTVSCNYVNSALTWKNGLRLAGTASLTCDVCEKWIPRETFPTCEYLTRNQPALRLDNKAKVLTNGKVEFPANERVTIICECQNHFPEWNAAPSTHAVFTYMTKTHNDVMYKTLAEFTRIEDSDVHSYECFTRTHYNPKVGSTLLSIQISDGTLRCPDINTVEVSAIYMNDRKIDSEANLFCRDTRKAVVGSSVRKCMADGKWSGSDYSTCEEVTCPKFPQTDGLAISYSNGNNVGSFATFRCSNSGNIIGAAGAQCLGNGTWSNILPSCQRVVCTKLPESDGLEITYTQEQYAGSIATFHCKPPSVLTGAQLKTCHGNGQWSNNLQTSCSFPGCFIDDVTKDMPENIIPNVEHIYRTFSADTETFPEGTEIQLLCEENLVLTGDLTIKCSKGNWKMGNTKCEQLCIIGTNVSPELIISPTKDSYRLGDVISLSCPDDYVLTSDTERVMCMLGSWTDVIPGCMPKPESEE